MFSSPQWLERPMSGLVGLVKGIVESVGSTVLLGVPAIAAAEERDKLKQLERMYSSIAALMENFMQLVKGHKDLLTTILVRVLKCFPANTRCLKKRMKSVSSSYIRSTFLKKSARASFALVMSILCSLHV